MFKKLVTLLSPLVTACAAGPDLRQAAPDATPIASTQELQRLRSAPPAESDLPPLREGSWRLACDSHLELALGGRLLLTTPEGERQLAHSAVGDPAISADGSHLAWSHAPQLRPETVIDVLACDEGRWGEPRRLVSGPGSPDRVALSPDGEQLVFVSAAAGVAALFLLPFEGGLPRQLTNRDLQLARPGKPPANFIPPPHEDPPRFEPASEGGLVLAWSSPTGAQRLELP